MDASSINLKKAGKQYIQREFETKDKHNAGAQKHPAAVEHTLIGQVSHKPYHDCDQWSFHLLAPNQNIVSSVFWVELCPN